ncbi:DNA binding protein [Mycobacterium phage Blinn1]|uniref:DNA binding protein n=1 Tax=Mycobacterium phage Blinn1 TaxID=2656562 RepID=A0A649VQP6_9CAUD|nr:sigma-K factor [Mycobacterium phage Blinn1]QGJ94820.1 DNA binding protein [Mycobacterium phage Blinn1]
MTPTIKRTEEHSAALAALLPSIKRAARSVAFQWPGVIDADDAEQAISLHLWERPTSLLKVHDMESKAQYRALVGMGHQLASQERDDYDYYKGSYYYSAKEVKDFLAKGILGDDQKSFKSQKIDIEEAIWEIAPQYHAAVLRRYADGEIPETKSEQHALSRGIEALIAAMNRAHSRREMERDGGPGSRKSTTNAQAYAASAHQYDGDNDTAGVEFDGSTGGFR